MKDALTLTTASGREIIRPCGLTDTPGGAAIASANVLIIGLIWSMRPMAFWRRAILLGLGFLAMGIIYLSQVRVVLLTTVASLMVTTGVFALRRNFGKATILVGRPGVAGRRGAGLGRVRGRRGGDQTLRRPAGRRRGGDLSEEPRRVSASTPSMTDIPRFPLGAGLGRWGQIYYYFGNKIRPVRRRPR